VKEPRWLARLGSAPSFPTHVSRGTPWHPRSATGYEKRSTSQIETYDALILGYFFQLYPAGFMGIMYALP
jgi:hypothetical protein